MERLLSIFTEGVFLYPLISLVAGISIGVVGAFFTQCQS